MKRRWIVALAVPALLLAGCDSTRFARTGSPAADRAPLAAGAVEPAVPEQPHSGTEQLSSGVAARISDHEPSNSLSEAPPTGATTPSGTSTAAADAPASTTTQRSPSGVQLASASSVSNAARRTFDAVLESLPNPRAAADGKLAREIGSFEPFPFAFDLPTLDGASFRSDQPDVQLIVVDIWATWCGPCRKAIPEFVAIQQRYGSRGVQVVGITCDAVEAGQTDAVRRQAAEIGHRMGVNYPLLLDDGTTVEQVPDFRGYPTTLFLTPQGQVVYKVTGMQSEAKLAAILDHLLPTTP